MTSPLDTYVAEYSALIDAEKEVSTLVGQINSASLVLGKEAHWKHFLSPAVGGSGFPQWPTTDQVFDKIQAYDKAFTKADLAYQALTAEQKVSVKPMPSR